MTTVFLAHTVSTLAMAGLIWFVQLVHYPLMARVGRGEFRAYHEDHVRRTGWVVVPLMVTEALTTVIIITRPPPDFPTWGLWLAVGLLVIAWGSTAWLQVPLHRRLSRGYEERAGRRLVRTNWIRTAAWSARAIIAVWIAYVALDTPMAS